MIWTRSRGKGEMVVFLCFFFFPFFVNFWDDSGFFLDG